MRKFKFYKEITHRWYVDLPEWKGDKSELEMVNGADSMLEYVCEGENKVKAYMSVDKFKGADEIRFVRLANEVEEGGAFYCMKKYQGIDINLNMWLCDVTKFVFGYFPQVIYISKIG